MRASAHTTERTRPSLYDPDLKRLFSDAPAYAAHLSAATFLRRFRKEVRRKVAAWTGEYQYTIDQVLEDMMQRCRAAALAPAARGGAGEVGFHDLADRPHDELLCAAGGIRWRYETATHPRP